MELPNGVRFVTLSKPKLKDLWLKLMPFDRLFQDKMRGDEEAFVREMLSETCIILETDGGIFILNNIIEGLKAEAHLSFWDRKLSARKDLIKECLVWCFLVYNLRRIEVRSPEYAHHVHKFLVKRLGFTEEGIMRKCMWFKGNLTDMHLFSILVEEVGN